MLLYTYIKLIKKWADKRGLLDRGIPFSQALKTKEEAELKEKIKQIFYENKQVYGSRRMSDALNNTALRQVDIK